MIFAVFEVPGTDTKILKQYMFFDGVLLLKPIKENMVFLLKG